jgi:hypothetical protein
MSEPAPVLNLDNPVSPKVIVGAVVALLVPAVSAALLYLQTDQGAQLYAALPIWLIVFVRALLTGLSTFLASYLTTDPLRILDLATSPKVIAATVGGVVVQAVVDVIAFLAADGQSLYANWPPVLVVAFSAVLPAVAALLSGLLKPDPARLTSANPTPRAIQPAPVA